MTRITMKQWHPLLLLQLLCFVISSSSQSTSSDSCTTALSLGDLIPFNTTGLSCFQAWTSQDFILRFGKDSSSKNVWSFVLSAPDSGGYIAVGFAPTAGRMVGSSAVAGWVDTSSSGAGTARQYYLGGTSSSSCPPDKGNLALSSAAASSPAIVSKGSRLYLAFQLTGQPITDVIYAVGPSGKLPSSNGFLPRHLDMTSGTITLSGAGGAAAGGSTSTGGGGGGGDDDDEGGGEGKGNNKHNHSNGGDGDGDEGGKGDRRNSPSSSSTATGSNGGGLNAKRRHGVLAAISWGITIPIGVAAARFMKHHDPLWFYAHAIIQGVGFVVGAVAIVAGFRLDDDDGADAHKGIGIAVLVGGCLQVMAVLARPVKEAKARRYWNWYHHYVGRAAVVLGAGNVLYGLSLAKEGEGWSYVYGIFVGVCAVVYLVLEEWRRRH